MRRSHCIAKRIIIWCKTYMGKPISEENMRKWSWAKFNELISAQIWWLTWQKIFSRLLPPSVVLKGVNKLCFITIIIFFFSISWQSVPLLILFVNFVLKHDALFVHKSLLVVFQWTGGRVLARVETLPKKDKHLRNLFVLLCVSNHFESGAV